MAKIFPLELTKPTDELKRLIAEHPDYPIVVLAGEDANTGDYGWGFCTYVKFGVEEILDCETPYNNDDMVCAERVEFNDRLEDWLWGELGGYDDPPKITEEEFQKAFAEEKAKYEPYWKKVIAIYADN